MNARRRPTERRKSILCFGDGNTHGRKPMSAPDDRVRYRSDVRWSGLLAQLLAPHVRVIEEGQPGRTTVHDDPVEGPHKNGLTVLPALLETHRPIDAVLLMLGTNDCRARFAMTASDVAGGVERLVRTIRASGTGPGGLAPRVVIVAPPPIEERGCLGETFTGGAVTSRALPARLGDVAARLECGFIDAGAYADVDPTDGVHLTRDGHEALARGIARYCRNCLL